MIVRELTTVLGFDVEEEKIKRLDSLVSLSMKGVRLYTSSLERVGDAIKGIGFGITGFVTVPFLLMSHAMTKAASDAEETRNKFDVIFRDIRDEAHATATSFAEDFGLAQDTSLDLLAGTADLAAGFGFSQERALELANQTQRLAGDLASFQNIQGGVREAGERLTRGILGETENLKLLGIAVNQGDKEFRALVKSIAAAEGLTERQAKVIAILQMAYEQSGNAIGDFQRTMGSLSNQVKILRENFRKLLVSFGKILIPVALLLTKIMNKMLEVLEALPQPLKAIKLAFTALVAIVGPILIVLGIIIAKFGMFILQFILIKKLFLLLFGAGPLTMILKWSAALTKAGLGLSLVKAGVIAIVKFVGILLFKIVLIIAAILAVAAAIALVIQDFKIWMEGGESAIGIILGGFERLRERVLFVVRTIKRVWKSFWLAITTDSREAWEEFKNQLGILGKSIDKFALMATAKLSKIMEKAQPIIIQALTNLAMIILKLLTRIFVIIAKSIVNLIGFILEDIGRAVRDKITKEFPKLSKFLLGVREATKNAPTPYTPFYNPMARQNPETNLAGGVGATRNKNIEQNMKLETNVRIDIPQGTPEEQERFLESKAQSVVENALTNAINQSLEANPIREEE